MVAAEHHCDRGGNLMIGIAATRRGSGGTQQKLQGRALQVSKNSAED
jgi:hypothetical protein